jgi:protein-L-isoaspartate(D-aspartate) O-methyltransferase
VTVASIEEFRTFYAAQAARSGPVHDKGVEKAFAKVQREAFLGPGPWKIHSRHGSFMTPSDDPRLIYQNVLVVLVEEAGINNGEPFLHGGLLCGLKVRRGERVVHIGAGTGYYSAILAELVGPEGHVTGVERHPRLAAEARENCRNWPQIAIVEASGTQFCPTADVIYANAGATRPLPLWLDALREGGRLLFPLTGTDGWGAMLRVERRDDRFAAEVVQSVGFVPMEDARDEVEANAITKAARLRQLRWARQLVRDNQPDESAVLSGKGWWLSKREL